jgi:hypothetical protein
MKLRRLHLVLLVLILAAPFAWIYRPLNRAERRLVGLWWTRAGIDAMELNLKADRTFERHYNGRFRQSGAWSASDDELILQPTYPIPPGLSVLDDIEKRINNFRMSETHSFLMNSTELFLSHYHLYRDQPESK